MKNQKMIIGLLVGAVVLVVLNQKGMLGTKIDLMGEDKASAQGQEDCTCCGHTFQATPRACKRCNSKPCFQISNQ